MIINDLTVTSGCTHPLPSSLNPACSTHNTLPMAFRDRRTKTSQITLCWSQKELFLLLDSCRRSSRGLPAPPPPHLKLKQKFWPMCRGTQSSGDQFFVPYEKGLLEPSLRYCLLRLPSAFFVYHTWLREFSVLHART